MSKTRIVRRYTGDTELVIDGKTYRPGAFISLEVFNALPRALTITQEIRVRAA